MNPSQTVMTTPEARAISDQVLAANAKHLARLSAKDKAAFAKACLPEGWAMKSLKLLRNLIAWRLLKCLYPQALAQVVSAGLLLVREESTTPLAAGGHLPAPRELVLLDVHPASPIAQLRSISESLGSELVVVRSRSAPKSGF